MSRPQLRDDLALAPGYHSPQVSVDVRLNTNEAPESPPAEFSERLAAAIADVEWNRYPDRSATALRARIAEVESSTVPGGLTLNNVLAANGSNEILQTLCLGYGGPGRCAAVFEPTYALHSHIARLTGTAVVGAERTPDFALFMDSVRAVVASARPSITFLCSPNNPTGMVEDRATVEAVLESVESVDGLLVVDEAYGQFAGWSALELISEERSLVVTRTYSKTWSAAALRLGYLIGPTWITEALGDIVLPYHLDAVTQIAGVLALEYLDEMNRRVQSLTSERERVVAGLEDLGVEQWPSGANFVLFRPSEASKEAGDVVWQGLVRKSVLVRNCSSWERLDGCLRVTIGTPAENDQFLRALGEVLAGD
jgi:histidinol-phosphate aminotransferase